MRLALRLLAAAALASGSATANIIQIDPTSTPVSGRIVFDAAPRTIITHDQSGGHLLTGMFPNEPAISSFLRYTSDMGSRIASPAWDGDRIASDASFWITRDAFRAQGNEPNAFIPNSVPATNLPVLAVLVLSGLPGLLLLAAAYLINLRNPRSRRQKLLRRKRAFPSPLVVARFLARGHLTMFLKNQFNPRPPHRSQRRSTTS
jgi:hypothetical protein